MSIAEVKAVADDDGFDTVRVIAEVPRATRDIVKEKHGYGGITNVIKDALMDAAHGEAANEKARLKQSLEEIRAEIRELKRKRADLDDRIDEKEATAARIEDQLEAIRDREGEYEGALAIIEQYLRGDPRFSRLPHRQAGGDTRWRKTRTGHRGPSIAKPSTTRRAVPTQTRVDRVSEI